MEKIKDNLSFFLNLNKQSIYKYNIRFFTSIYSTSHNVFSAGWSATNAYIKFAGDGMQTPVR